MLDVGQEGRPQQLKFCWGNDELPFKGSFRGYCMGGCQN